MVAGCRTSRQHTSGVPAGEPNLMSTGADLTSSGMRPMNLADMQICCQMCCNSKLLTAG